MTSNPAVFSRKSKACSVDNNFTHTIIFTELIIMGMGKSLISRLLDCLEMFLLMPSMADRFTATKKQAFVSFLVPFVCLLWITLITYKMQGPLSWKISMYFGYLTAGGFFLTVKFIVFLILMRIAFYVFNKSEYFYNFVFANNWLNFVTTVILTPTWFMLYAGKEAIDVYPFLLFSLFYCFLTASFMAHYVTRLDWLQAFSVPVAAFTANAFVTVVFGKIQGGIILF